MTCAENYMEVIYNLVSYTNNWSEIPTNIIAYISF